jgi:hypothetical protein
MESNGMTIGPGPALKRQNRASKKTGFKYGENPGKVYKRTKGPKAGGRQPLREAIYNRRMDPDSISAVIGHSCCTCKCLEKVCISEVTEARREFALLSADGQLSRLIDHITMFKNAIKWATTASSGPASSLLAFDVTSSDALNLERLQSIPVSTTVVSTTYRFNSMTVCRDAYQLIHGISDHKMNMAVTCQKHGVRGLVDHKKHSGKGQLRETTEYAIDWFARFCQLNCDIASAQNTPGDKGHWYLPAFADNKNMWQELVIDFNADEEKRVLESKSIYNTSSADTENRIHQPRQPISLPHFIKMRKEHFSHVIEPTRHTYGVCEVCLEIGRNRNHALHIHAKSSFELEQVNLDIAAHRAQFCEARRLMAKRQQYAYAHQDEVLYLGFDYTVDFNAPTFRPRPHMESAHKMEIKTGGIIDFTTKTNYVFGHFDEFVSKGGNAVSTLLWNVIRASKRSNSATRCAKRLWLQVDGGKENTNHIMFAFCATLVDVGWFEEVVIYRLPVGHTHCIIDQRFAPVASVRKDKSIKSLFSFFRDIPLAWTDVKQRAHMIWLDDGIIDWEGYVMPHWTEPVNLQELRQIKFEKRNKQI